MNTKLWVKTGTKGEEEKATDIYEAYVYIECMNINVPSPHFFSLL